ncbi:hydrolase [Lysinibacillus alkalisoli]|uniref:Hydrolase n=1 Tax=Lysinibacillus alkalisoli TaxID=1911548 RepID=A0A917G8P7_9BACI|nr:alpha/beta hydrolase [Lysinibacillus alkalisoli]GGG29509.1 hydrolase [Lysinibacillus alkalisoli]
MSGKININLYGHKDKTPLIFLHGLNWTHLIWNSVIKHLKDDFFIIAVDLPGHGNSERLQDYSFNNIARVINETISDLNLTQKVTIIGSSIGASIALTFASMYDIVKTVVLVDGGFFALKEVEGLTWENIEENSFPNEVLQNKASFINYMKSDNPNLWNNNIEKAVLDQIKWSAEHQMYQFKVSEDDQIQYMKDEWNLDVLTLLKNVQAKIVLLIADNNPEDDFLNSKIDTFQSNYKDSLVYRLRNTDHLIMLDAEQEFIKIIKDHFQTTPRIYREIKK